MFCAFICSHGSYAPAHMRKADGPSESQKFCSSIARKQTATRSRCPPASPRSPAANGHTQTLKPSSHQVMCGYVICPLGESRRRRRSNKAAASAAVPRPTGGGGNDSAAAAAAANNAGTRISELMPSSEFTMYAHTDLGGNLPASVINKLCKKPAYRALRKVRVSIWKRSERLAHSSERSRRVLNVNILSICVCFFGDCKETPFLHARPESSLPSL